VGCLGGEFVFGGIGFVFGALHPFTFVSIFGKRNAMLTKEKLIDSINKMPDKFSVEELFERILLLEKIERGLDQSIQGNTTPQDQLEVHLPKR
jgi:hypothetical protein